VTQMIHAKMVSASKIIGPIAKDRLNKAQNYRFRGIDDVLNRCNSVFTECGLTVKTEVLEWAREDRSAKTGGSLIFTFVKLRFTFTAEDDSTHVCEMIGEGMDSGDKSSAKAVSMAYKNCVFITFNVPVEGGMPDADEDEEQHDFEPRRPQQSSGGGGKVADDPMSQFWAASRAAGQSKQEGAAFLNTHGGDPARAVAALSKKD